jgi:ABC-type transport system substrate-binding protein
MLGLFAFILVFSVAPIPIAKAASAPYFSITLIAPTSNPVRRQWAQIMQNSFISADINTNLVYMTFAQWLGLLLGNTTCGKGGAPAALPVEGSGAQNCPMPSFANGGWDAGFVGEGGGTVLPDFGTQNVVLYRGASANDFPPNGSNFYWWYNSTYNALAADYGTNFNAQARLTDAQKMVKIVADQRPGIIIDYPLEVYAWNPAFKPWGTSNAITSTTAGLDFQHWQTGSVSTINAAVTGGLDAVNPLPNPAQNSFYDRYLYGPPTAPAEEPDARGSGVYYDSAVTSVTPSADHLTYTVTLRPGVTFQDGVTVTADDYVFTNMATAITAVAYVGGGTTLSIIGNQDSFTFLNGTTDYVNAGAYQHGGSAPWSGAASSVWKSLSATSFSFTLPTAYLFADPLVTGGFAIPMHLYEQIPWGQWQTSPLSGFTSGCSNGALWSSCSAGGLSQNNFKVTWNSARYGGNGSYIAYGPVGDGAYVYHGYNPTTQTGTLVKYNNYYNATGLVALHEFTVNTINVVSIPAKDAAIAAYGNPINFYDAQYTFNKNDATQLAGLGAKVAYVNDPANGWQEMPLNNANTLWGTGTSSPKGITDPAHAATYAKYIRTALSYLTPRQEIVQNLLLGLGTPGITEFFPTSGVVSPGDIYQGVTVDPLNQATALGYLAAAGYNTGYAPITSPGQTTTQIPIPPINVTGISLNVPGFFLGNSFTLTGAFPTIPGIANGYFVTLQESTNGGTTWTPIALTTASGGGAYSISYTPVATGNQQYRVFFTGIVSSYVNGSAGPLQRGGLADVGPALVQSYDFPAVTHQCSGLPSRGGTCAANSTDIQFSSPQSLNVGTYSDLFAQLATGINSGLTGLAKSTNTAIQAVSTNVGTLSSQLTALQSSAAKASDVAALQTTVNNLNSQVSTLTDVAYAALAVAVILGLLAIFLSRRKSS